MLWILPLAIALLGAATLLVLAARAQREADPTKQVIDGFGRKVRPALVRVREVTERTRRRLD